MTEFEDKVLRPAEVAARVGVSRVTLWRMRRDGSFPAPVRISARAIGWRASDVAAWIAKGGGADR